MPKILRKLNKVSPSSRADAQNATSEYFVATGPCSDRVVLTKDGNEKFPTLTSLASLINRDATSERPMAKKRARQSLIQIILQDTLGQVS